GDQDGDLFASQRLIFSSIQFIHNGLVVCSSLFSLICRARGVPFCLCAGSARNSLHFATGRRASPCKMQTRRGGYSQIRGNSILACLRLGGISDSNHPVIMNNLQIKGNWNIAKGRLKQKFAQLTDDDLRYVEGQEEEMVGRLQKLTGETREQMVRAIRESLEP